MTTRATVSSLPLKRAVYALVGGTGRNEHIAYVGIAKNLRNRISQHLIRRDSSVTSGATLVCLNPEYVTEVRWWQHGLFRKKYHLEAAEILATERFNPTLRSLGKISLQAKQIAERADFKQQMGELFKAGPTGTLEIPNLQSVVERIEKLEARLDELEKGREKRRK